RAAPDAELVSGSGDRLPVEAEARNRVRHAERLEVGVAELADPDLATSAGMALIQLLPGSLGRVGRVDDHGRDNVLRQLRGDVRALEEEVAVVLGETAALVALEGHRRGP